MEKHALALTWLWQLSAKRAALSPWQSGRAQMDALESLCNAGIGLVVSWAATWWLLPFWGFSPSAGASAGITGMFFVLSFARAFMLRAVFRRLGE